MKNFIVGFFVLLTFLTAGFREVQAMVMPPIPFDISSPVISGVSGPQFLEIGQSGTWEVSAYSREQGNLSYSVDWGDVIYFDECNTLWGPCIAKTSSIMNVQQAAVFSHSYAQAGNYTPTFIVTNNYGQSSKTSLSIRVNGNEEKPLLKVISPNGGEKIKIGQKYSITWKSRGLNNSGAYIYLVDDSIKCPAGIVGCWSAFGIGGGGYNNSSSALIPIRDTGNYLWDTNEKMFGDGGPNSVQVRPGQKYKIKVCIKNICDESDNYFKITSSDILGPVISEISGPQTLRVNQTGTWKVEAHDKEQGNLSYSVDWGELIATSACQYGDCGLTQMQALDQTATFSHSYGRAGNYIVRFTVINSRGQSISNNFKVKVYDINTVYSFLKKGNRNNNVRDIQSYLSKLGYNLTSDGIFGLKTEAAVKNLQTIKGIPVTGIVDDITMKMIAG